MSIYGKCEKCGGETKDYQCADCLWEKCEELRQDNQILRDIVECGKDLVTQNEQIMSMIQARLQPAGSPPPGGPVALVDWITTCAREAISKLIELGEKAVAHGRDSTCIIPACECVPCQIGKAIEEIKRTLCCWNYSNRETTAQT